MDFLLFGFLVVTAAWGVARLRDLFAATMLLSLFSLLSAGLFMVMDAVDVAFTEASVGAGISTVLFLATLSLTRRQERRRSRRFDAPAFVLVLAVGGLLLWGTLDMPAYGDPGAPIHNYLAPHYLEHSASEIGPPNIVTSVLASYRGYDTFGEATVVFTAAIGALLLLTGLHRETLSAGDRWSAGKRDLKGHEDDHPTEPPGPLMHSNVILRVAIRPLIPFILMFALYVQFHGDYGPGGGFQAGVIFAAGVILTGLVWGLRTVRRVFTPRLLEILIASGVLLYGTVGFAAMVRGGNFLDYNVLRHDPVHGQHLGILLVELGVGLTVASVMIALFLLFTGRGRRGPSRHAADVGTRVGTRAGAG
jgi:multicomponent Na+:H+ antiporter subunit B